MENINSVEYLAIQMHNIEQKYPNRGFIGYRLIVTTLIVFFL